MLRASKDKLFQCPLDKLHWQDFVFFWPPTPFVDIFNLMNVGKKSTFLDYLTPSCCKRSLWTIPYSETGILVSANFYQRNATVFLGKLPGTAGTFTKKKIPDVQNLEDETKWDLNVSLGLVSFICGHLGTLYDDDDQSCWYKVPYKLKK